MNCNDTLTYAKELRRMCATYHICKGCPLQHDSHCLHATAINGERIGIVQRWSDCNSESFNNEAKNQFIKDFKAHWGSDVAEEDFPLYLELIKWIREEFEKI